MSLLKNLQNARNRHDIARILDFQAKKLSYILYIQPEHEKYHQFQLPKKSGEMRIIQAPRLGLKTLQRRLANLLSSCESEINKEV